MNSATSSTEDLIRFDKGATGYLELFTRMNEEQLRVFQPILNPAGEKAQLMFANILEAAKFSTASEITVRQNERLMKLKRGNVPAAFDSTAAGFNQQAIRHAGRALRFVKELRAELQTTPSTTTPSFRMLPEGESAQLGSPRGPGIQALREAAKAPEFSEALADAKEAFLQNALQLNFTNNSDFVEVLEIWDETMDLAHKEGVSGVLGRVSDDLEKFVSRRNSEERGTSPASPLEWWKYVMIAVYIGAAVFGVVACFWWSACTWVWPAISATAPWIFKIVEMGC
jgi:hypothetical protein